MRRSSKPRLDRQRGVLLLLPNLVTLSAMAAGLTALHAGLAGAWHTVIWLIVVAAVLDGLDGRLARRLGACTRFGAQLDNLSDLVSFGVVPAVLFYSWALEPLGAVGWALSVLYVLCCALRLARFITAAESQRARRNPNYFQGLPSPAAAASMLLPIIAWLAFGWDALRHPPLVAAWIATVAVLMISNLPVYGFKAVRVTRRWRPAMLLALALIGGALLTAPLETLFLCILAFLATLPVSALTYRHHRAMALEAEIEDEEG